MGTQRASLDCGRCFGPACRPMARSGRFMSTRTCTLHVCNGCTATPACGCSLAGVTLAALASLGEAGWPGACWCAHGRRAFAVGTVVQTMVKSLDPNDKMLLLGSLDESGDGSVGKDEFIHWLSPLLSSYNTKYSMQEEGEGT